MIDKPTQNAEPDWFTVLLIVLAVVIGGYCFFTLGCKVADKLEVKPAMVSEETTTTVTGDNASITNVYNKSDYGVAVLAGGMAWALLRSRRRTKALDRVVKGISTGLEHDFDARNIIKWINTNGSNIKGGAVSGYDRTEQLIHARVKALKNTDKPKPRRRRKKT